MLAAKLQTSGALPQGLPEQPFWNGHFAAQAAGEIDNRALSGRMAPSTALRAVPLPVPGRQSVTCAQPSSLSFTTLPPCVRRIALPISSSSTGRPASLSQNADRKL